ncbi:hypothetical protein GCM10010320_72550 [Streptomyces caelestis]|nr:hypothetical protein GCM10010320_72550 [Streptomyces caelestis]
MQCGVDVVGQGAEVVDGLAVAGHGGDAGGGQCRVEFQAVHIPRGEGEVEALGGVGRRQQEVIVCPGQPVRRRGGGVGHGQAPLNALVVEGDFV